MDPLDLADQTRLLQSLLEKTIVETEIDVFPEQALECDDFRLAARELARLAADLARIAEDMTVAALGGKSGTHNLGDRVLQVRRSYKRTEWEHSKLGMHVALRATGGEMTNVAEIVDAIVKACNPSWRVTVLKEMDLDSDEYCVKELGRATVSSL